MTVSVVELLNCFGPYTELSEPSVLDCLVAYFLCVTLLSSHLLLKEECPLASFQWTDAKADLVPLGP